ncbi:hypothetical protein [Paraliomyxa miuraensis]|uniref:hypothetical protein n=1 Tax=Paraliomyxa miuraensis TaxID=376150 RepID=UPI002258AEFD|nr:hypothetical protein [Paraliomyxa miuraensis]MCX4244964.1 hypothetical protein [Paraliomyxa miuraensis]
MMILALAITGCSGGGESTTAAETVADTGSTSSDTTPPDETGPQTDTTPGTGTGTTAVGSDTGDTEADTTAGEETAMATTTGECPDVELVGEWLSEGENVAPLLAGAPFNLVSIQAIFDEVTYEVNSADAGGSMYQQTGTWTADPCPGTENKFHIVLEQTAPSALTAEGIYEIDPCMDPAMMRYEVIQVMPDIGFVAPTCDDDFGTVDPGADNTQVYVRQ